MDESAFRSMIEDIPLAIFWFKGMTLEWQNAFASTCFSGEDANAAPDRLNALLKEHFSSSSSPINTLTMSGREFYVGAYRSREYQLVLLIPVGEDAVMFPEISKTRQAALDFEDIFRNSFDGIFVTDGAGVTLMVNEGCERNYDLAAADLIGRHVSHFERKGWIRPVVAAQVARTGQRISTTQRTHKGKTILVTGMPLFDSAGNVRKVVINSRDTTELLQLQDALAKTRENLRRVDQEIQVLRLQNLKVEGVVLRNESMQRIASMAARVAKVDVTVLITGKSGVGKDVITHLIHRESTRAGGPLIKINCGALPRDLLESELFGYEAGAFTGAQRQGKSGLIELAHKGTLFLDEIGDMPLDLQVKLLHVLQDRVIVRLGGTRSTSVDVRIIAATNRDLKAMVEERTFRDDLFYRLNVVPIFVPPLAERKDDIPPLIQHFMDEFNAKYELRRVVSEQSIALLLAYDWPGNVRELRNVVERLVVTSQDDVIEPEFLDGVLPAEAFRTERSDFRGRVERFERRLIEDAMREHGSTRDVAKALGLSQSSVVRKLHRG